MRRTPSLFVSRCRRLPVFASQKEIELSPIVARVLPSGEKVGQPVSPASARQRVFPAATSQTQTQENLSEASNPPSGERARRPEPEGCPSRQRISFPVAVSQTRTTPG